MPEGSNLAKLPHLPKTETADYEVGYGKPPKETRFKPGQSGNPRGRPKGSKNKTSHIPAENEERLKKVILEECYRKIGVRDGDRLVEIPVIQAVVRSLALTAAKGNLRAQRMLTEQLKWVERERKAEHDELLKTMIEYKTSWQLELARRAELGIAGPRPYPHPDDIHINMATGKVDIRWPMTEDEEDYARILAFKISMDAKIVDAEKELMNGPNCKARKKRLEILRSTSAIFFATGTSSEGI
jgi:hypothetical protein